MTTSRRALLGALVAPLRAIAASSGTEGGSDAAERAEAEPAALVALLEPELCVAHGGGDCRLCLASCVVPGALLEIDGAPLIDEFRCDGCGACALVCTTATDPPAIRVVAVTVDDPQKSLVEVRA